MSVKICVRVSENFAIAIRLEAKKQNKQVADFIRDALRKAIDAPTINAPANDTIL